MFPIKFLNSFGVHSLSERIGRVPILSWEVEPWWQIYLKRLCDILKSLRHPWNLKQDYMLAGWHEHMNTQAGTKGIFTPIWLVHAFGTRIHCMCSLISCPNNDSVTLRQGYSSQQKCICTKWSEQRCSHVWTIRNSNRVPKFKITNTILNKHSLPCESALWWGMFLFKMRQCIYYKNDSIKGCLNFLSSSVCLKHVLALRQNRHHSKKYYWLVYFRIQQNKCFFFEFIVIDFQGITNEFNEMCKNKYFDISQLMIIGTNK